jgi:hypothetical protein
LPVSQSSDKVAQALYGKRLWRSGDEIGIFSIFAKNNAAVCVRQEI